jgi:hypothetical protein
MAPYLSWIHDPEWVYCPLDRLHQGHRAYTELVDKEFLLPNTDAVFACT